MPIIILIPAILCIVALFRDSVSKAFLNVYLPVFLLCPIYYFWKISALPPIDASEAVLVPLGIAMLLKELPRWRISTMDLWVAVFIFTSYFADSLANLQVASTFELFACLATALVPYMAGKLLIEQPGARTATLKRIVFLMFLMCIVAAYEYRMGQNPFTLLWARFFPGETFLWKTQIRWGWGRVSGPYGQSELAGIVLLFGLVLTLYLGYLHLWEPRFARAGRRIPFRKSTVIAWTIGITLLMTQARGPWIGALVAVPIAFIGRSKRILRTAILVVSVLLVGGSLGYIAVQNYVSASAPDTEAQQNAQYRSQLVDNYIPVVEKGGPWGWGQNFPRVEGQDSIDNEYLFVALTQGWVGLTAFCLLAAQALFNFLTLALFGRTQQDRYFAFSMLGIFVGTLVTLYTVYLGNQPFQLFFLLVGWSEALRVRRSEQPQLVFEHVYT